VDQKGEVYQVRGPPSFQFFYQRDTERGRKKERGNLERVLIICPGSNHTGGGTCRPYSSKNRGRVVKKNPREKAGISIIDHHALNWSWSITADEGKIQGSGCLWNTHLNWDREKEKLTAIGGGKALLKI